MSNTGINLNALETKMPSAIRHFWIARKTATNKQQKKGTIDQGNRSGVTAGKNMNGFIDMTRSLIIDNGLPPTNIFTKGRSQLTLPGFFRPTKTWDLLVINNQQLLAAIEFKSQVGPSFGNNFNNRVEESIGNAVDIQTAYRENVFQPSPKPFLGYFFVLEETLNSTSPIALESPHFKTMPEFIHSSYATRYDLFCKKLLLEQHYDAIALVLTSQSDEINGTFRSISLETSVRRFKSSLAGRIAAFVAEQTNNNKI